MSAPASPVAVAVLLALAVAVVTIGILLRSRAAALVLDLPNHRSLHQAPTPRIGGLGILAGVAVACLFAGPGINLRLLIAITLLIVISVVDDMRSLGVIWRMLTHLASAALAASALLLDAHGVWAVVTAALAITWMTNLYNFMDGSDGLAGAMAICGFGSYGIAALCGNDHPLATITLSIAAATGGFLLFNFPPARVFMGDAGAIPLGFLAAVCGLAGWQRGVWPLWFGAVVFSPFIIDATVTLLRRLARGARIWEAHREHFYQRLVQSGWGHRKTLYAEITLMLAVCTAALTGMQLETPLQSGVLLAIAVLYATLIITLERKFGLQKPRNV